MMFFCILFNYTILRNTKDVLVVTAPGAGAEIIPFLKTYVQLPGAIAFTVVYSSLCNVLPPEQVFLATLMPFLGFYSLFSFVLYPARNIIHPHVLAMKVTEVLPKLAAPIAIIRNWSFSAFYLFAELWGSVVLSVLFWGQANSVMNVKEAKKYYPLFGLGESAPQQHTNNHDAHPAAPCHYSPPPLAVPHRPLHRPHRQAPTSPSSWLARSWPGPRATPPPPPPSAVTCTARPSNSSPPPCSRRAASCSAATGT